MSKPVTRRQFLGTGGKAAAGVAAGVAMHTMIREGQRRGEITAEIDPATLTDLFAAMLSGAVLGWAKGDPEGELAPRMEALIRVFFRGVGK